MGEAGAQANGRPRDVKISADGDTVLFPSNASNLVSGGTTLWDLYTSDGAGSVEQVSLGPSGAPLSGMADFDFLTTDIGADGSIVLFGSPAGSLAAPGYLVLIRDRLSQTTQIVSADASGTPTPSYAPSFVLLTDDGRSVMLTTQTRVVPGREYGFVPDRWSASWLIEVVTVRRLWFPV